MKKRLLEIALFLIIALICLSSCETVQAKASPNDCLVVIKTEIINPVGLQMGREWVLNYSDGYAPSNIGDNNGKFITVVIGSNTATTTSVSTETRPGYIGPKAEYKFAYHLPYEPGEIVIADFVLTDTLSRSSTSPNGSLSNLGARKITNEERNGLISEIKADNSFATWHQNNAHTEYDLHMSRLLVVELAKTGTAQQIQDAIDRGANVNAQDNFGFTALMVAARYNENPGVITTLLKAGAKVKVNAGGGQTPLMLAARFSKDPDGIIALLEAGADVHTAAVDGWTPLIAAAAYNQNTDFTTALLNAGADIKSVDDGGRTALMEAAWHNRNSDVITVLLKAGADLEIRSKEGSTPLMIAARHSTSPEVVSTLLKAGADLEARSNGGWTSLMIAAKYNSNPEVISTLLKAGADAKVKDKAGKTAFDCAQENDDLKGTDAYLQLQQAQQ